MKKAINPWIIIFCISIFLLVSMFSYFQIKEQLKPPSAHWSNAILIDKTDNNELSESTHVRVTTVEVPSENMFITFWNGSNSLNYSFIDKNGRQLKSGKLTLKLDEPVMIKSMLASNNKVDIFSLVHNQLDKYSFDYKTGQVNFVKTIAYGVASVQQYKNTLYLAGEHGIQTIKPNGEIKQVSMAKANAVDAFVDSEQNTHLAYLYLDNNGMRHLYYTKGTNAFDNTVFEIGQIVIATGEFGNVDSIIIGQTGKRINIMVPIRSYSQQKGRIIIYSFDINTPKNIEVKEKGNFYAYYPNPVYISKDGQSIDFLVAKPVMLGNKTETTNIVKYSLTESDLIEKELLTKLKSYSINPNYFILDGSAYLQWENVLSSNTKIMYASSNPNVIKLSEAFHLGNFMDALLNCLVAILFSLTSALLVCPVILIPAVFIVGTLVLLFLDWVENNSSKVTIWIIRIHTVTAMLFTAYLYRQNSSFMRLAPQFLHNSTILYLIILVLSIVSYLCMRIRFQNKKIDNTFLYQYSFFVIINFVLYSLLVFPWDYI